MIKRPAQHTAVTFLTQRGIGVATLLLVIILFPIILLLAIGVKVGIVLGLHFVVEYLTGSWFVLYLFGVLTGLFTVLGFISRTAELGRYYSALKLYIKPGVNRAWYTIVFTLDFLVTDMLTLTASALLAYAYWMVAVAQNYMLFYEWVQPFIALSILGGLLQILFSAYYLTHTKLQKIYLYATQSYLWFHEPVQRQVKPARRRAKRKSATSQRAKKAPKKAKSAKRSKRRKSSRRKKR